jgi:PII-like signaling protein
MKLTVIVGGDERQAHHPLYRRVMEILREFDVAGATLTKGVMSYGCRHRIHTILNEVTMENLPIIIEVVDAPEKIEAAAERIAELLGAHGLVQIHPTAAVRPSSEERRES